MPILVSSLRMTGHLRPLLPYAVRVAAPKSTRGLVEKQGLEIVAIGHPGDERLAQPTRQSSVA